MKPKINDKGFTLIEILIALAFMGVIITTVINTVNYNLSIIGKHKVMTIATILAREKFTDVDMANEKEEKGYFDAPYEDYSFELNTITPKTIVSSPFLPKITIKELKIKHGEREIVLKKYYLRQ